MFGSENAYAGALFFALVCLGALIKLNDIAGCLIGAGSALLAAISLRLALVKAAQEAEENHQRMEIQFQQLRSKIIETSATTIEAMTAVNDAAQSVQENIQVIRVRLAELDNLTQLAECAEEIKSTVIGREENNSTQLSECAEEIKSTIASLEENSSALNLILEREFETLNSIEETKKESLQTILKLVQLVGQMLKNPAYVKDIEKINSSINTLTEQLKNLQDESQSALNRQDLSTLKRIAAKIK